MKPLMLNSWLDSRRALWRAYPLSLALLLGLSLATPASASEKAVAKPPPSPGKITKKVDEVILPPGSPQLASLRIEPVVEIDAPAAEPLNGKIAFDENHTARISSPVAGRVSRIFVEVGDTVKAGQKLLAMDSPDLGEAIADVHKAQSELLLKRQAFERSKLLLDEGVIARKDYENNQAALAEAEAEARRTRAKLENLGGARDAGSETYSVRAPITGVVVDRQVNPGNEVRPDAAAPLFIITDPAHLWATIDLPERDLGKVSSGQAVNIEVEAYPGEIFSGHIQSIGAMVDPTTRRIPVRCVIDAQNKLKPEMYARITPLSPGREKVIRTPNEALITEGIHNYVFVEISPGHLKKKLVVLNSQGREYATIKQGLSKGERLVTGGAVLLNSELSAGK